MKGSVTKRRVMKKERKGENKKKTLQPLLHSLQALNNQGWAKMNPEAQNSI